MNLEYFSSGDGPFFFNEQIKNISWLPHIWDSSYGFGEFLLHRLWLDYPFRLFMKVLSQLGLSWFIIEKLLWISMFALAIYSSKKLAEYVLGKNVITWVAPLIYAANTYILLLFGGGQIGVAWAYSFSPFVIFRFIQFIDHGARIKDQGLKIKDGIVNGLFFALLVAFDLRFAYLMLGAIALYYVLMIWKKRLKGFFIYHLSFIINLIVSLIVAVLVHAFWILPVLLTGGGASGVGEELTSPGMLKFLSVADFSHALSLLHPNWPENLFGKVYFLQPEFLVLPVIAFGSLVARLKINDQGLMIKDKNETKTSFIIYHSSFIKYFVLLAVLGAFFAKGVNEPFGEIYAWMFTHIPGFVMFRDPTKFFLYVALGYSILIPYSLQRVAALINDKGLKIFDKTKISFIFNHSSLIINYLSFIVFIFFWVFLNRSVFTGQVTGNFRPAPLPEEYVQLKDMLVADNAPSRTLWIPQKENYAYASDTHPLLATESAFVKDPLFIEKIFRMGVKYVIVPPDIYKRLFLTDYRFDPSVRIGLIDTLQQTSLKQNMSFRDIAVFENDRFIFERNTPTVVAKQQKLAYIGLVISVISLVIIGGIFIVTKMDKKQ